MGMSYVPLVVTLVVLGHVTVTSSSSLYQASDPIVQLNGDNFFETIKNTENAWFIEFYATWCGHCQRMAPLIKALAVDVQGWSHMIKIGAIACSEPRNTGFCRRVNIRGYPTLRFFPPYLTSDGFHGIDYIGAPKMRSLQESIVDYLSTIHILPASWPKMEPVSSVQEVLHSPRRGAQHILAIAENPSDGMDRYTAKKLLFDLSGLPEVHVMRMRTQSHPSGVYSVYESGVMVAIAEGTNRQDLKEKILRHIRQGGLTTEVMTTSKPQVLITTSTRGLHLQDLESSLYNTLWVEVGGRNDISGPALKALKNYIRTLKTYFPGPVYIKNFLTQLNTWLQKRRGHLRGETWVEKLDSIQSANAYVPLRLRWTGCAGSLPLYRGYPCSLWQTFHALTINALERNVRDSNYDPQKILVNIREYVRHFLGCRECAQHFLAMSRNVEAEVERPRDGVLWLWRAHNRVNRRLSGDATEDPHHPKKEFPTVAQCPTCRIAHTGSVRGRHGNETAWNEEEVMIYLRRFYGADFVIPDSLPYKPVMVASTEPSPYFIPNQEALDLNEDFDQEETPAPEAITPYPSHQQTRPPATPPTRPNNWWTPHPTQPPTPEPAQPWTHPPRVWTPPPQKQRWTPPPVRPGPAQTPAPTSRPWTPKWTPVRQTPVPWPTARIKPPENRWIPPGDRDSAVRPTPAEGASSSCPDMSTTWSPCSCTCGTGVSTRMSNQNPECKTKLETRICQLRPCNYRFVQGRRRSCGSTYRSADFLSMTYNGCETTSMMKWRYCGECYGKCCYPKRSRTQEFGFVCGKNPESRVFGYAKVHIIELCECSERCP